MFRVPGQTINVASAAPQQLTRTMNFDNVISRRGSGSLKYDSAAAHGYPDTALPLWVADMDFPAAPPILDALQVRLNHGIFGYVDPPDGYYQAISNWWRDNHNYELRREWIQDSPGVMFSIALAIRAFTRPGDSVMVQTPVYYPFYSTIQLNNRNLVECPINYEKKEYTIDFEAFQETLQREKVKLFLLCSPHNPVGRVWTQMELEKIGSLCIRNNVIVVSDEIHCDITAPNHKHRVFAGLDPRHEQITITLTSPTKTFNLSGLQISQAFIANQDLRNAWLKEKKASGYDEPNVMGVAACQAAYEGGREWLTRLKVYVNANEAYVREFIKQYIPGVAPIERQGTYLLWMDCWGAGFSLEEMNRRLIDRGKLWLYDGSAFGVEGEGFQRLNLACPRETLTEAMMRLAVAFSR
ncbi:MAG: pyridoxal phosphate-dependent aminotransferase [Clostridiales bacterium]|nr:pyridoxal phosphate-dependent aminotransferase [Clostridiales bacterium]